VSRLDFAPPINEMKVDLEEGTLEFIVRVGMHLDKEKLKKAIEDAGYRVGGVEVITLGGREGKQ
jgi:copper chaperone CopZ